MPRLRLVLTEITNCVVLSGFCEAAFLISVRGFRNPPGEVEGERLQLALMAAIESVPVLALTLYLISLMTVTLLARHRAGSLRIATGVVLGSALGVMLGWMCGAGVELISPIPLG